MPFAPVNGINVYYEDHGSGFPVLMIHGYAASTRMWAGQAEPIGARYRLITMDMRGHGQTDSPEAQDAYSEAATVEDMRGLLQHLGIEKAVIGGLSLGGYMTMGFYCAHPEMCQALILCDTGPGYRNPTAREGWNKTAEARAERFEREGLAALGGSAEVRASAAVHRSAVGLAKAARGMLAQFDAHVMESLDQIRVPSLLIIGANDTPFLNGMDYMAKKIPGAEHVVIPDAGHASNIDQPQAFNETMLRFLDRVTR